MASRRTVLSIALALMIAGCTKHNEGQSSVTPAQIGRKLPATRIRGLDSTETQLVTALNGRPALVTLWATWCDACREEMPALNRLDAWARDRGAVVVGVAVGEPIARISSFATEKRVPYLVLVDEEFLLADALGEKRVPATLVIDRTGSIVYVGGAFDDRSLAAFRRVLDESAPSSVAGITHDRSR